MNVKYYWIIYKSEQKLLLNIARQTSPSIYLYIYIFCIIIIYFFTIIYFNVNYMFFCYKTFLLLWFEFKLFSLYNLTRLASEVILQP